MFDEIRFSNKELLLLNGLLSENSTEEQYEDIVMNFNSTLNSTVNLTLKTCSLSKELDGVSDGFV